MSFLESIKNLFAPAASAGSVTLADVEPFRRSCWIPVVAEGDGGVLDSKFAGIPYLSPDEDWPVCPNCKNPMQLFLQLNSDGLPADCEQTWGEGLLQFFYCTNTKPACEYDLRAWDPFSPVTLLRVVVPTDSASRYTRSPVINAFPPKRITEWTKTDDLPAWDEMRDLGLELPEELAEELAETYPREGEKLLGWPAWVQSVEYPECPECKTEMGLVFQIDSYKNLPHMFGDAGTGHITQCPIHKQRLAFGWACS